jgi:predicted DNA-binding transcriptional regulator AlpA
MPSPQPAAKIPPLPPGPVPRDCLLTWEQVRLYLPISYTAFFRGMQRGWYPAATHFGGRSFWHSNDIADIVAHGPRGGERIAPRGRPPRGPRRRKPS